MSFLKKVKYNYYQNNLNDLKKTNDLKEIIAFLKNLANSKPKIYEELIEKNIDDLFQYKGLDEFFPKNLIWINSFLSKDADLIKHFLEFYLQNAENFTINNYFETALEHYDHSLDFNQFVEKVFTSEKPMEYISANKSFLADIRGTRWQTSTGGGKGTNNFSSLFSDG